MSIKSIKLYRYYNFLFWHYMVLEMSCLEIGRRYGISGGIIQYWLKKNNIPRRSYSESGIIAQNKPEVKEKQSGENNPNWGKWKEWEELSVVAKHRRKKKTLKRAGINKPPICPFCNKPKNKINLDLMNIDHKYLESSLNWFYICHDCHDGIYHYLAGLKKGHKIIQPIPNLIENLIKLETREEREKLLKKIILNDNMKGG